MSERFLGIDFSGGEYPWKPRCPKPTVWIATLDGGRLDDLRPVQDLAGAGEPFDRLTALLKAGEFRAAGIDAPFSLPARHMPPGGHAALLKAVGQMPPGNDRPFPRGDQLFRLAISVAPLSEKKPKRETEATCGAPARSTLWHGSKQNGGDGAGTPFTAACLALLGRAGRPVWPWTKEGEGLLVEAFPMAQLRHWGLPFQRYGPPRGKSTPLVLAARRETREIIIAGLVARTGLDIPRGLRSLMADSADALDAVVAAFGAKAAATGQLRVLPTAAAELEGWIAVHD